MRRPRARAAETRECVEPSLLSGIHWCCSSKPGHGNKGRYGDGGLAIDGQITQTGSKGLSFVRATMCQDAKKQRAEVAAMPRDIGVLLTEIEKEPIPDKLLALAKELQEALVRQSAETTKSRKRS